MKTRILLVNFEEKEKDTLSKLDIDVDLGYLSDTLDLLPSNGEKEQTAYFYSPYAIYDYKAIFIKLTKKPPLESQLKTKAKMITENDRLTFFQYWYSRKGILGLFSEDGGFSSLDLLGIPHVNLIDSRGNDKTISFLLDVKDRPLRCVFDEIESLIIIPPKKYLVVENHESRGSGDDWTIFRTYGNRNDEEIGAYLNWGNRFSDEDEPAFFVLPSFKDYSKVMSRLLKAYSKIYPKYFPEISELDWTKSDRYFPKEVSLVDDDIKQVTSIAEAKVKDLLIQKEVLKQKYSHIPELLTESGDKLKEAVMKTLIEIFNTHVEDMDKTRKNDFREDLLIKDLSFPPILVEVKGTKNSYPSFTYVSQVFSNLIKEGHKYPGAIGGLILNLDRDKEPKERSDAYIKSDEKRQLNEIVYIDTRVLFELSIAIIDHKMPLTEAKGILFQKGRVSFSLDRYLKQKEKDSK